MAVSIFGIKYFIARCLSLQTQEVLVLPMEPLFLRANKIIPSLTNV